MVGTDDTITENAGEGTDTVQSSITWILAANLENLTLTGTTAISGAGNDLDNILIGNTATNSLDGGAGNDTLNGGAGSDALVGGIGNDTYAVDNVADIVTELANEGIDLIQSSVSYTLAPNVENMTLTGTKAINATGNLLNNILIGNSGINTLTGGAGNDRLDGKGGGDKMLGGTGDDVYVVDVATDAITENVNEGIDSVESTMTYTLGSNLENLTLTGTAAINGTGNSLGNVIVGNAAANIIDGGLGSDTLTGGAGVDHFKFSTALSASNVDTLTDFVSGTDKIDLSKTIFTAFSGLASGSSINAAEIGNHIVYQAATGSLSYDADGSVGAGVAVQIAVVGTASHPAALQGIDFNIVA